MISNNLYPEQTGFVVFKTDGKLTFRYSAKPQSEPTTRYITIGAEHNFHFIRWCCEPWIFAPSATQFYHQSSRRLIVYGHKLIVTPHVLIQVKES